MFMLEFGLEYHQRLGVRSIVPLGPLEVGPSERKLGYERRILEGAIEILSLLPSLPPPSSVYVHAWCLCLPHPNLLDSMK